MQITVTKEQKVTEVIDVPAPCCLYTSLYNSHSYINMDGDIVIVYTGYIVIYRSKDEAWGKTIQEALQNSKTCTKAEFDAAFNRTREILEKAVNIEQPEPVTL